MSVFKDIIMLKVIGVFVILFVVGTSFLGYFFGTLNDLESEMGITSHSTEFASLEFVFAFAALLAIAGAAYILFRQHNKKKKFEEGN